jgi:hypothetical protein
MVAIKDSGATRRGAGKSARPPPIRPRNLGKTSRQDTPTAEEVQGIVRRPGHKDIVRLPAGMSSDAGGRERPHHLIVEMARVPGIALRLTLANSSAIARVRRPNLKGLWRAPWRCHRSGSYFVRPCLHRQRASAEAGSPGQAGSAAPNTRLGAEDIPENTRPGPAVRWKAVDHLRLLRLLIGLL